MDIFTIYDHVRFTIQVKTLLQGHSNKYAIENSQIKTHLTPSKLFSRLHTKF